MKKQDSNPSNLGTIVGWGKVTPSPWLENLQVSTTEWLHLFFQIGAEGKIEALCRSLRIEQSEKPQVTAIAPTH